MSEMKRVKARIRDTRIIDILIDLPKNYNKEQMAIFAEGVYSIRKEDLLDEPGLRKSECYEIIENERDNDE